MAPGQMGDGLLGLFHILVLLICLRSGDRMGDWLEARVGALVAWWYSRTVFPADREGRDRPFPFRR